MSVFVDHLFVLWNNDTIQASATLGLMLVILVGLRCIFGGSVINSPEMN